jgi:hypothetical protein
LLLTLVVGLGFSWVHRAREQQAAGRGLLASNPGAAVLYDHEVDAAGGLRESAARPHASWLGERLGVDYRESVVGADLFYPTDADLACLARFPNLRRLVFARSLDLTDRGIEQLAQFTELKRLVLGEADQVTDAGLLPLARLANLTDLRLDLGRRMTPAGIERLRRAMPNCQITVRSSARQDELARF